MVRSGGPVRVRVLVTAQIPDPEWDSNKLNCAVSSGGSTVIITQSKLAPSVLSLYTTGSTRPEQ